ncbi:tripartite motif-containing protein 14-like [Erpetoichthys calabaricus]|uniref:Tripartite motif-containing protein 14-like n=1 Tax=Erpetoichthys calabaricus TaxID=27687 RepID=A0A8C4S0H2_ERPCA|nr:tripartite motif-containing protein 14-like [Erpetoichthys calabaricus]
MSDISSYSNVQCIKHNDSLILYCKDCLVSVCCRCLVDGEHKGHAFINFEDACKLESLNITDQMKKLKRKIKKIDDSMKKCTTSEQKVEAMIQEVKNSVNKKYREIQEKLKQDEEQSYRLIEAERQSMIYQIQHQTECSCAVKDAAQSLTVELNNILSSNCDSVSQLMEINSLKASIEPLHNIHKSFDKEVQVSDKRLKALENSIDDLLVYIRKLLPRPWAYSENITLNQDTAHVCYEVSADETELKYSTKQRIVPIKNERFITAQNILANQKFSNGRHYWEVTVQSNEEWTIGVASESIARNGNKRDATLGQNKNSWALNLVDGDYLIMHNNETIALDIRERINRLGVFLDYEEGRLSFYKTENKWSHIFTFKCKFRGAVFPAFSIGCHQKKNWPLIMCHLAPIPDTERLSDIDSECSDKSSVQLPEK